MQSAPPMALRIKIPAPKPPKDSRDEFSCPGRLSYPILVEYAKNFKTIAEIDAELAKMLVALQHTEKEKAKHKASDPNSDVHAVKLARFTQLFKTLLALKASYPHVKIPYFIALT